MKSKKTIKQGLGLAVGVFAGNAIIVPMISGGDVARGIIVGFIAAALVLVVYSVIAVCQSDKPCQTETEKKE
jgi:hypothetical protein